MNVKVGNSTFIKNLNQKRIFKLIHKEGPITRKELADNTDYSAGTISNHVKALIDQGFVIETEKGYSSGGRKPVYLTVNPDKGYIISVEVEVTRVKIVLFNLKIKVVAKTVFPINGPAQAKETISQIFSEIEKILSEREIKPDKILGIGVAVPGLIDKEEGLLEFAPNLGWSKVPIVKYFEDKYGVPVVLENEANAAAVGEKEFVYPDIKDMVYVSINEGIGCGLIFNGRLYRGAGGNAGEFGHIIIDSDGPLCHCGNSGCWETLASENHIQKEYQELTGEENVEKNEIYRKAIEGEDRALSVVKQAAHNIGLGLANIVNSLSPRLIVLGGGIIEADTLIIDTVQSILKEKCLLLSYDKVDIEFTRLKDLACLYGLASYVFNKSIDFETKKKLGRRLKWKYLKMYHKQ